MKSFKQFILERYGIEMPKGSISGEWFAKNGLPVIVSCCCCDMTMASPSAWIDNDGYVYCSTCADTGEE